MLIRKKLTAAEFSNPALRYNSDCDCIQFTPDDGATWIDQPSNDPRTSDAYRLPALTGGDAQCRAAEGMTALVRACVDQRIEFDTDAELAAAILGIVAFIPGFNVLYALILAFVGLAVTIARELLEAAFTEDVYDTLRCTFFCHIDPDGQMDQEAFDAVYAEIDNYSLYPNVLTQTWVHAVMDLVGPVGMSDAGVQLEAAADCDECQCTHCFRLDLRVTDGTEYGINVMGGTYEPGVGYYGIYGGSSSESDTYGNWSFGAAILVDFVSMGFTKTAGSGANNVNRLYGLNPVTGYNTVEIVSDFGNPTGGETAKVMTVNEIISGVGWDINSGTAASLIALHGFEIYYRGDIPAGWSDNC